MDKWLPKVGIWNLQEHNALECCRHCQREKREHLDENITNIRLMSTEKSRFNWNFKFKERNKTYYDLGEFWPYRSKPQCKPSVGVYGHLCLSFLYLLFPIEFWKVLNEWKHDFFLQIVFHSIGGFLISWLLKTIKRNLPAQAESLLFPSCCSKQQHGGLCCCSSSLVHQSILGILL